jgi:DNA-binding MarR family transcriptional regulator
MRPSTGKAEPPFLYGAPRTRASASNPARCAGAVLEIGLLVTRLIRREVRRRRPAGLSLQQFRALAAVASGTSSPSPLAEHLGLAPATVSKLVDDLVTRRFLRRSRSSVDRRGRVLVVTPDGRAKVRAAFVVFRAEVARRVKALAAPRRARITETTEWLRPLLVGD